MDEHQPPSPPPPPDDPPAGPPPPPPGPVAPGFSSPVPHTMYAQPPNSGKAVASLVLGIAGFVVCPLVCSVLAIIFGKQAQNEIDANPVIGGRGMATAGFILGIVGVALSALFLLFALLVVASGT